MVQKNSDLNLSERQKEYLFDAGKFNFTTEQMALFFDMKEKNLKNLINDPETEPGRLYQKGKAEGLWEVCKGLEKEAKAGNCQAAKELRIYTDKLIERQAINEFFNP